MWLEPIMVSDVGKIIQMLFRQSEIYIGLSGYAEYLYQSHESNRMI